ncbi:hypothetical protein D5086_029324 [Populus alba]|uniref:Uncharacterized protein n=1 Tax=Populus alba TaxID=43335 RepID=A0ACC4ATV5_POPAL
MLSGKEEKERDVISLSKVVPVAYRLFMETPGSQVVEWSRWEHGRVVCQFAVTQFTSSQSPAESGFQSPGSNKLNIHLAVRTSAEP